MTKTWPDRGQLLDLMAAFRPSCVLGAAAELDLFDLLGEESLSAQALTQRLDSDLRATTMLLDALAALNLLDKREGHYSVPPELRPLLTAAGSQTVLPMVRHGMNILRGWAQLAWVTKSGIPGPRQASIRGFEADRAAFIAAMHTVSGPIANDLVAKLGPPKFTHLLDVGGASGTWTLAFLRATPDANATIFDLPDAIHEARERLAATEFADRVTLVPGDFYHDDLPGRADFAWVSAIIHQHSRENSRELYAKVHNALVPGGRIAIRDVVMNGDRTHPQAGALFAINMLVNTETGGTFTFEEIAEDLHAAGFVRPELMLHGDQMDSVVVATRPER